MAEQANQKLQESLSALMDDQASELELRRLLKAMKDGDSLSESWSNYHLAASAMRGELSPRVPVDYSAGIMAALEAEPAHRMTPAKKQGFWGLAGKFAVAASVAGAVVIGAQQFADQEHALVAEAPAASLPAGAVPEGFASPDLTARTVNVSEASPLAAELEQNQRLIYVPTAAEQQIQNQVVEEHLNQLMLEHASNAAENSAQGLLPYARVAPEVELRPEPAVAPEQK
ncbi:sigma-E factor negative regulatory protein [Simiduia agarivorans]|uniref:MucA n=1 Tax=Simiduia agarivorans (strain DSM 21679 / JCM 13881 / BCRC 17597 / SA1) TaxID=1117647 RepID=K4KVA5_SIMAS|nr:sigma-E factor negative regulatory protein [Simiduia agarivorans]AFU97882.1 mucA [Simiduia agarivorans SA1 = DSM 21679]